MSEKKSGFLAGAAILTLSGLLVKIIGVFFRIPLTNILGTEGMGLFGIAYPTYNLLLTVSTSGLPAAISRQVAEKRAQGDALGARGVFFAALKILLVLGVIGSVVMFFGADWIAGAKDMRGAPPLRALAPALLFVAVLSAFRGYFQGLQQMVPTAATQVVEQVGKVLMGLYLAKLWLPQGLAMGAAGALLGITLSEAAALVLIMGIYARKNKQLVADAPKLKRDSFSQTAKSLMAIAIPVTIGASIMPIMGVLDQEMVPSRLIALGFDNATSMYGVLTGVVNTLVNMPSVFSMALAMSLVPSISSAFARPRGHRDVIRLSSSGVKMAMLFGLPAAVGLGLLAQPVVSMLYRNLNPGEPELAASLIRAMAPGILMLSLVQTSTAILQGIGRPGVAVRSLAIGAVLKAIVSYTLLSIPSINIVGAQVGTAMCYTLAAGLNIIQLAKNAGLKINFKNTIAKPFVATAFMAAAVWGVMQLVPRFTQSNTVLVAAGLGAGALVYGIMLLLLKTITQEELDMLPGGKRLGGLLGRFISR